MDFPIAMFGGNYDKLADPQDVAWTHDQIKDTVFFFKTYDLGHMSFAIAKDMSYFTKDVMTVLAKYNDKCTENNLDSNYEAGNEYCKSKLG